MFDQAFDSLRKATQSSMEMQQDMMKKWVTMWPGGMDLPSAGWADQVQKFQRNWMESANDMVRRQREIMETQFKNGMQNIEKAFHLGEAKNIEELRTRTMELWQKCFESLRQAYEAQIKEFQTAMEKWMDLVTKAKV